MKRWITRRNVLRGAGVCLALPWLESLLPRKAQAEETGVPRRFLLVSFPNGAPHHWWETAPPFGTTVRGPDFKLPVVLDAFAPLKSKMLMISRLGNYTWRRDRGTTPDPFIEPSHARCFAAMTTCVDADQIALDRGVRDLTASVHNGISVDQLIVARSDPSQATALPSLQTGLGVKPGFFDERSYAYNQAVSWKSETEPLKRRVNPKAVFDLLVAAGATSAAGGQADERARLEAERRAAIEQSVLDAVREDASALRSRLGSRDRQIVEQYLDALRDIEKAATRVEASMRGSPGCASIAEPGAVAEPPGPGEGLNHGDDGYDHEAHADVMNDLIAMALQCDVTRVVTHMLDDSRSEFEYRHVPAADRAKVGLDYNPTDSLHFHASQHLPGALDRTTEGGRYRIIEESNKQFAAITCWLGRKAAELAQRLDAMPEGEGTVLDHTVMVFMSEMRTHDHDGYDLPIVLLGGKGVFLNDAHVAYEPLGSDRQLRDLWFTILNRYHGLGVASFGDDVRGVPNALLEEILV